MSSKTCTCLLLSQSDVIQAGATDMSLLLSSVEDGFRLHGTGECSNPPKVTLGRPGHPQDLIMALPGYLGGDYGAFGTKWVLAIPENVPRGIPRSSALIILNDGETGWPLCVMDGTVVNVVRTGAVSGVGARYLARPDARRLCLVGAGPQGRLQAMGLAAVLPFQHIDVFDLDRSRAESLAAYLSEQLGIEAVAVSAVEPAVRAADVVVTATVTREPYLHADWLRPGTLYVDMASHDAHVDVYQKAAKVVTDDWAQIKAHGIGILPDAYHAGVITDDTIYADLGEIVAGKKQGRTSAEDIIVFKHIGIAATDLPVAYNVYRKAKELGLGTTWTIWDEPWSG